NEGYTLAGAKLMEWVSGMMLAMIAQELLQINIATSGPLMIVMALGGVFSLAAARSAFPDEERGLRNSCMVALGFAPPGIPTPAQFRPYWSGAPMRQQPKESYFSQLGLDDVLAPHLDGEGESVFLGRVGR
ncbi:MAG: hypothetical protein EBZ48_11410, partial [Proteobacteria bacterium]|nr:hypothetical protein [Pseudomonadota bacterium]